MSIILPKTKKVSFLQSLDILKPYFSWFKTYGADNRRIFYCGRNTKLNLSEVELFFRKTVNPTIKLMRYEQSFHFYMDGSKDYVKDLLPEQLVQKARKNKYRLSQKEEQQLLEKSDKLKKVAYLIQYCQFVLHGRWKEAEPIIVKHANGGLWNKDPYPFTAYAKRIVKDRWIDGENLLIDYLNNISKKDLSGTLLMEIYGLKSYIKEHNLKNWYKLLTVIDSITESSWFVSSLELFLNCTINYFTIFKPIDFDNMIIFIDEHLQKGNYDLKRLDEFVERLIVSNIQDGPKIRYKKLEEFMYKYNLFDTSKVYINEYLKELPEKFDFKSNDPTDMFLIQLIANTIF